MLSTDNWCIKVADRIYGPYTTAQMKDFAAEGRVNAQSMLAPAGGKIWREARQYPNISELLERRTSPTNSKTNNFGKSTPGASKTLLAEGQRANFILIFDVTSGAAGRLEHIINNLGTAFRLCENVWALVSEQTVMGIKNALGPHLQIREPVFVIDTSRGRSAWQNFAPETHSKLTKAWIGIRTTH